MNRFLKTASEEEEGNGVRKSTLTGAGLGAGVTGIVGALTGANLNDHNQHITSLNKARNDIFMDHRANPEGDLDEKLRNAQRHPTYLKGQSNALRNGALVGGAKSVVPGALVGGAIGYGAGKLSEYRQKEAGEQTELGIAMLSKQAYYELEDPEIQNDPEFLAKTEAYENARAEADKYPNGDKARTAALGLLVGGGALTGGVLGHKLLGAPAGAFGAMNGALAGAGLLSTMANPAIERRLEKKHPGRTEAKGKAMSAFDDVMNAEDDFYDRKYGTPGDREAREYMFGKNASDGVGLAMLGKQADELDEWRNSRDELESLKDELNGLKQKDPKAHAARASQVGDHYRQLHQRVYDAPNAKQHYVADVKAGHTNKQASSEREDYETNLRQESKMPETAALLGWGAGAAAGGVLGARFAKRRGIKDSSFAAGGAALGSIPLAYAGRDVGEKMLDHKVNKKSDEEFGKQANEATYVGLRPGMREEALDANSPLIAAYADTNEKGQAYQMANNEASKLHRKNETTRQVGAGAALVGGTIAGGLLPLLASRGKGRVGQFANNHSDALVQGGTLAGGIGSVMTANSALKNRGDKKSEAHNNEVVLPKYEAYRASEDDLYEKLDSEGYETMGVIRKQAGNLEEELREEKTSEGRNNGLVTGLGLGGGMLAGAAAGERFGESKGISNQELLRMKGHDLGDAIHALPAKAAFNERLVNKGRFGGMLGGGAIGLAAGSATERLMNREAEFTDLRNQMLKVANTY